MLEIIGRARRRARRRHQHGVRGGPVRRRITDGPRLAGPARHHLRLDEASGGLGHALPYLVSHSCSNPFWTATALAGLVVPVELWINAWIRAHSMDTPMLKAIFQIVLGGAIVLATGILIGAS